MAGSWNVHRRNESANHHLWLGEQPVSSIGSKGIVTYSIPMYRYGASFYQRFFWAQSLNEFLYLHIIFGSWKLFFFMHLLAPFMFQF